MARQRGTARRRGFLIVALACGAGLGPAGATGGWAQSAVQGGGGVGNAPMKRPPSGAARGPGSGISSEPPDSGIAGHSSGSAASTGGQGTSGGNMESGGGRNMRGPTGSRAPGTGPGASPPQLGSGKP